MSRDRADSILRGLSSAQDAKQRADLAGAQQSVAGVRDQVVRDNGRTIEAHAAEDLQILTDKFQRRLRLGQAGVLTP